MRIDVSNFRYFHKKKWSDCLKNRQSSFLVVTFIFLSISCGKVINHKKERELINTNVSFLMMERECHNQIAPESQIAKSIRELYQSAVEHSPQSFFYIYPRSYDYKNPLVLSLESMNRIYLSIKDEPTQNQNAEELYYLYNGSRRFEDQKCLMDNLRQKKKNDLRSYFDIVNKSGLNSDKENALELCRSFSGNAYCQEEFKISQKNNKTKAMIGAYFARFKKERYDPLFKLRSSHQMYNCQKLEDDKIVMTIKVLEGSFSHDWLVELAEYVEEVWSNQKFSLKLELVKTYSRDVVTLLPVQKGISYVPDNNNRIIYLSNLFDLQITKRIFAHEFGHVLGFPDCYIEFFDDFKKELVYYELSKNNINIMCSLKEGVKVQDDYFAQLIQNSCLFK